jgi:hypothetical protein
MSGRVLIISPRTGSQVAGMFAHRLARALRQHGCTVAVAPIADSEPPKAAAPRDATRRRPPPRRALTPRP